MPHEARDSSSRAVFFTHEFKRNLRQLAKKYRRIQTDIQPTLTDLQEGQLPGDHIPDVVPEIYKVRTRNADSAKGKSGGYRIVYQKTPENTIILLTVYSKTEQSDISVQEIQSIIDAYAQAQTPRSAEEHPSEHDQAEDNA